MYRFLSPIVLICIYKYLQVLCRNKIKDLNDINFHKKYELSKSLVCNEIQFQFYSNAISIKPVSVTDYNKFMGGVDKVDQMLQPYPLARTRGMKWTLKVFKHFINITILNSFTVYNYNKDKPTSHLDFRKNLTKEIFTRYGPASFLLHKNDRASRNNIHYMKSSGISKPCYYCAKYRNIKKVRTVWTCSHV